MCVKEKRRDETNNNDEGATHEKEFCRCCRTMDSAEAAAPAAAEAAPQATPEAAPQLTPAAPSTAEAAPRPAPAAEEPKRRSLRKRARVAPAPPPAQQLLSLLGECESALIFTGSGVSASAGMSTFSAPGGLYEQARRRYGLDSGKRLFSWPFFAKHRPQAQAFFAKIFREAAAAEPTASHAALASLARSGKVRRVFTMNVDGLHRQAERGGAGGGGGTVEMHGCVLELVCAGGHRAALTQTEAQLFEREAAVPCATCGEQLRSAIMLYGDKQESIVVGDWPALMNEDLRSVDLIVWAGISFEQSASVEYFRRVHRARASPEVRHVLINPDDSAAFNLRSAISNLGEADIVELSATSDELLPVVAEQMRARADDTLS